MQNLLMVKGVRMEEKGKERKSEENTNLLLMIKEHTQIPINCQKRNLAINLPILMISNFALNRTNKKTLQNL